MDSGGIDFVEGDFGAQTAGRLPNMPKEGATPTEWDRWAQKSVRSPVTPLIVGVVFFVSLMSLPWILDWMQDEQIRQHTLLMEKQLEAAQQGVGLAQQGAAQQVPVSGSANGLGDVPANVPSDVSAGFASGVSAGVAEPGSGMRNAFSQLNMFSGADFGSPPIAAQQAVEPVAPVAPAYTENSQQSVFGQEQSAPQPSALGQQSVFSEQSPTDYGAYDARFGHAASH